MPHSFSHDVERPSVLQPRDANIINERITNNARQNTFRNALRNTNAVGDKKGNAGARSVTVVPTTNDGGIKSRIPTTKTRPVNRKDRGVNNKLRVLNPANGVSADTGVVTNKLVVLNNGNGSLHNRIFVDKNENNTAKSKTIPHTYCAGSVNGPKARQAASPTKNKGTTTRNEGTIKKGHESAFTKPYKFPTATTPGMHTIASANKIKISATVGCACNVAGKKRRAPIPVALLDAAKNVGTTPATDTSKVIAKVSPFTNNSTAPGKSFWISNSVNGTPSEREIPVITHAKFTTTVAEAHVNANEEAATTSSRNTNGNGTRVEHQTKCTPNLKYATSVQWEPSVVVGDCAAAKHNTGAELNRDVIVGVDTITSTVQGSDTKDHTSAVDKTSAIHKVPTVNKTLAVGNATAPGKLSAHGQTSSLGTMSAPGNGAAVHKYSTIGNASEPNKPSLIGISTTIGKDSAIRKPSVLEKFSTAGRTSSVGKIATAGKPSMPTCSQDTVMNKGKKTISTSVMSTPRTRSALPVKTVSASATPVATSSTKSSYRKCSSPTCSVAGGNDSAPSSAVKTSPPAAFSNNTYPSSAGETFRSDAFFPADNSVQNTVSVSGASVTTKSALPASQQTSVAAATTVTTSDQSAAGTHEDVTQMEDVPVTTTTAPSTPIAVSNAAPLSSHTPVKHFDDLKAAMAMMRDRVSQRSYAGLEKRR